MGRAAKEDGPDVHCGTRVVRWHVGGVEGYSKMNALKEVGRRNRRDGDERSRVGHAGGVLGGAKDGDAVGGSTEGFKALVGLLTVVEGGRHTMEAEEGVGDEGRRGPL